MIEEKYYALLHALVLYYNHLAIARIEIGAATSIAFLPQLGKMFNEAVHVVAGDTEMVPLG